MEAGAWPCSGERGKAAKNSATYAMDKWHVGANNLDGAMPYMPQIKTWCRLEAKHRWCKTCKTSIKSVVWRPNWLYFGDAGWNSTPLHPTQCFHGQYVTIIPWQGWNWSWGPSFPRKGGFCSKFWWCAERQDSITGPGGWTVHILGIRMQPCGVWIKDNAWKSHDLVVN